MEPGGNYEHFVWIYSPPFCQIPPPHTYYLHSTDTGREAREEGIDLCDRECDTLALFFIATNDLSSSSMRANYFN